MAIDIVVELNSEEHAIALAELAAHIPYSMLQDLCSHDDDVDLMREALDQVKHGLANVGYEPR